MKKVKLTYFILLFSICGFSQNGTPETAFWRLANVDGEVSLGNFYWKQQITRDFFKEELESSFFTGSLFLNTKSYFWHPNFLELDLDVGYSPETGQRLSLVTPDRNEVNTLKKVNARALLFQHNAFNVKAFLNFNENYNNRENLTNLKSDFKNWGTVLNYTNKYLPFTVSYQSGVGEQLELQTNRSYTTEHTNLEGSASKSFGANDRHQFRYSYSKYLYENSFLDPNQENYIVKNDINSWTLNSYVFLDAKKNYSINSLVSNENQQGNFNYKRFQVSENLFFKLPSHFNWANNYSYFDVQGDLQQSKQHNIISTLSHQLYESLNTSISYEYNDVSNTQYSELINRAIFDVKYTKKIPLKGRLTLSYRFVNNNQDRKSEDAFLNIQNEEYTLTDGQIILLNTQNVDIASVIVKDATGSIIYQLSVDYILIDRNEYLEIQRVPGGQISNNETVFIDYTAIQPKSYQFTALTNYFTSTISFWNSAIQFYYNTSKQDYVNPVNIDYLTLNYFNQKVYGSRFKFKFVSGGIEYDDYKSTIIPYKLTRYYLVLQGNLRKKLFFTVNGTVRDYQMIVEEGMKQKYYNISGNVFYNFNTKTRLFLEASYLKQEGEGIDLDLTTARAEFSTRFRQLFFSVGVELYKNIFYNENIDFKKLTIRIARKF